MSAKISFRSFALVRGLAVRGLLLSLVCAGALAQNGPTHPVLDLGADFATHGGTTTSDKVSVTNVKGDGGPALDVKVMPAEASYPGIDIVPPGGKIDLSNSGYVMAKITNTSDKKMRVTMRLDNDGDWHLSPFDQDFATILPGKSGIVQVYFGYSFGTPAYKLDSAAITHIKFVAPKAATEAESFRIESVVAGGKPGDAPPIDPATIRVQPTNGVIFGKTVPFDGSKQLSTTAGAKANVATDGAGVEASFTGSAKQTVLIKPAIGRWDLRACNEVVFRIKNVGSAAVTPMASVASNEGSTDTMEMGAALQPGQERSLVVSFIPAHPWKAKPAASEQKFLWNGVAGTGTDFASDKVSALVVGVKEPDGKASLLVESVATAVSTATLPDWAGKRPPVAGEWVPTFDEEFNGTKIDETKWNLTGDNYYDQRTHWTRDNVIVANGVATFRYEKKTGTQNDDPAGKKTDYAAGFLDTFGKYTQQYGYFEARMKLPTAPGIWPAFWMMPDRGPAAGDKYKRLDTHKQGMEIDTMEFLSRWGIYRYNIALHWDGYAKEHHQTGSTKNYIETDKDGFILSGVLWEPGLIVFYCNDKEIARFEDPRVPSVPEDMMFTMPSGGWDNDQPVDSKLPADFVVDYVRAWQRKPGTGPGTGAAAAGR